MLLNFQLGEDCPCPEEIRDELYEFHDDLLIHCGEWQGFVMVCICLTLYMKKRTDQFKKIPARSFFVKCLTVYTVTFLRDFHACYKNIGNPAWF